MTVARLRTALVVLVALAAAAGAAHAQSGGSIYDRFPLDPADRAAPAAPATPVTPAPETPSPAPAAPSTPTGTSEGSGMTVVLIVGGILLGAFIIAVVAVGTRRRPRPATAARALPAPAAPAPTPAPAPRQRSPHALPFPDHPVAAPPPRWKPKGHSSPYPDHPVAATPPRPHLIRATDLPYPVTGPQPEEQPFVPVRRFERRAERSHDVPYPAGPRRRNVAPPSPAGGTAVATRQVATAVTSIAAAPAGPRPAEEPPRRPGPEPEPPVRGPYGTTRIPTGELVGGLAADAARAAAAAAANALVRAPEARRAIGRALRQARQWNGRG